MDNWKQTKQIKESYLRLLLKYFLILRVSEITSWVQQFVAETESNLNDIDRQLRLAGVCLALILLQERNKDCVSSVLSLIETAAINSV